MKPGSRTISIVIALVALGGLLYLMRVAQRYQVGLDMQNGPGLEQMSVEFGPSVIISREQGVPQWKVETERIDLRGPQYGEADQFQFAEFHKIHSGVIYREGKPEAKFSANTASYDQIAKSFSVRGEIRFDTVKGDHFQTPELVWTEKDDFVRCPQGANGRSGKNSVKAPSLLYSPKMRVIQCPEGASAVFEGRPLQASALYWDLAQERVNMPGHVTGERKSLTFTGDTVSIDLKTHTLSANKATLFLRKIGEDVDLEDLRR